MTARDASGSSGTAGGEEQAAEDAIQELVDWYDGRLVAERRAPVPDEEWIGKLKAGRQAALADAAQLATADPEESSRVAAVYAARLKGLTGSES
ncbi:hypothetical protein ACGFMM_24580 [Streptomyces sp. NPDC048604]|uniref:hypothetical protein n=1 Tax=Streptomyces sp. NPDC048604 TaxID=3365578 RepID=UPI0037187F12